MGWYTGMYVFARLVQVLSRKKMRKMRGRTHEDPLKEVAALQYLAGEEHPNVLTHTEVRRPWITVINNK